MGRRETGSWALVISIFHSWILKVLLIVLQCGFCHSSACCSFLRKRSVILIVSQLLSLLISPNTDGFQ